MRKVHVGVVLMAALGMFGCVETSTLVTVNPDGSGTIALRENFSPQMLQMMESMVAAMEGMADGMVDGMTEGMGATSPDRKDGGQKGLKSGAAAAKVDFIGQSIEKSAAGFGPGVKLAKSERRVNGNGWKGFEAEYSFADVTQLQVPKKEKTSDSGGGMSMGSGPSSSYRFEFTKGNQATLRIVPVKKTLHPGKGRVEGDNSIMATDTPDPMPAPKASGVVMSQEDGAGVKMDPAMEAQMQQQSLMMMKGARMVFYVRINGTVTETNARFKSAQHANVFTVFDVNLDELMKDKQAAKLVAAGDPSSSSKLATMNIPGIRAEDPEKTITISFR